jgi:hypothetical protein
VPDLHARVVMTLCTKQQEPETAARAGRGRRCSLVTSTVVCATRAGLGLNPTDRVKTRDTLSYLLIVLVFTTPGSSQSSPNPDTGPSFFLCGAATFLNPSPAPVFVCDQPKSTLQQSSSLPPTTAVDVHETHVNAVQLSWSVTLCHCRLHS